MGIILLLLPAVLSLSILEVFIKEIKEKSTWFKIKYLSIVTLVTNLIGCGMIAIFRGEEFDFIFERYAAQTVLLFEGMYILISIVLTFIFIGVYNRIIVTVERQ